MPAASSRPGAGPRCPDWAFRKRDYIEGEHPYDLWHAVYQEIHCTFESIGLEVCPRSGSVAHLDKALAGAFATEETMANPGRGDGVGPVDT